MSGLIRKLVAITVIPFMMMSCVVKAHPHQHSLMGSHGMLVFADKQQNLYVSHMPLYVSPHNYQIIYRFNSQQKELLLALLEHGMVSFLPRKFDLQRMLDGELFSIEGQVYQGHFERGGEVRFQAEIRFEKALLTAELETGFTSEQASFYALPLGTGQTMLVHKIQSRPSFDAIGFIQPQVSESTTAVVCTTPTELSVKHIKQQLLSCGLDSVIYVEVQDFMAF